MFPTNQNFLSANAGLSNGNNVAFPMYLTAAPTSTTIRAPYGIARTGQLAVVPGLGAWLLISLTCVQGVYSANWVQLADSNGPVQSVLGTASQITATTVAGTTTLTIPATFIAPGSIASTTSISSGTSLTVGTTLGVTGASTLGALTQVGTTNINASGVATTNIGIGPGTGVVNIGNATGNTIIPAGNLTLTLGNVVASAGNIASTLGSVSAATTITAGTGLTVTTGDILVSNGDIINSHSDAGTDVTIEVTNSDNTNAASRAGVEIATGGASSGDPYLSFQISGVGASTMSMGLDNSASDLFVISNSTALGTSNAMTLSQAGALTATTSITSGTTVTATLGDITATNGNLVLGTSGNKINHTSVATVAAAVANSIGTVVLVGGTETVTTTAVTTNSLIKIWRQTVGATGAAALGELSVGTIVNGTSFVINAWTQANATALQATDVSVIGWEIIN